MIVKKIPRTWLYLGAHAIASIGITDWQHHHHHHQSLTARVNGAPRMILQPVFSIFPCSPLPSETCRTPGNSCPKSISQYCGHAHINYLWLCKMANVFINYSVEVSVWLSCNQSATQVRHLVSHDSTVSRALEESVGARERNWMNELYFTRVMD